MNDSINIQKEIDTINAEIEARSKAQEEAKKKRDELIKQAKSFGFDEIKAIMAKYQISDEELVAKLGIKVATQSKSTPRKDNKAKPPRFYYEDTKGEIHKSRGTSPTAFMKQPWFGLVENRTINDHKVTHYITNNDNEVVEVWTKAKGTPPENAIVFENNNGVKDIDKFLGHIKSAK
ncbi:TPA: hypothetical protein ACF3XN_003001 [Vibrio parahaemolyticus]